MEFSIPMNGHFELQLTRLLMNTCLADLTAVTKEFIRDNRD